MEEVTISRLEYDNLQFRRQQIEELYHLAEQLENGELDSVEFGDAVLNVL